MTPQLSALPFRNTAVFDQHFRSAAPPAHGETLIDYLGRSPSLAEIDQAEKKPRSHKWEFDVLTCGATRTGRHARRAFLQGRPAAGAALTAACGANIALTTAVWGSIIGMLVCIAAAEDHRRPRTFVGVLEDRTARDIRGLARATPWEKNTSAKRLQEARESAHARLDDVAAAVAVLPDARLRSSSMLRKALKHGHRDIDAAYKGQQNANREAARVAALRNQALRPS